MKLDSKQIHLWCIRDALVPDELLPSFLPLLSPEELKRYERFYFDRDKRQFLITRATLRCALSEYFPDVEPAQWKFEKNDYGRPHIAGPHQGKIQFNLSHTSGLIVLALTQEGDLGVDVENLARKCEPAQLADRFFSKVESEALLALNEAGQRERFFDLWTLKESYIKACGMGLAIPLESFSFLLETGGVDIGFTSQREDNCQPWRFWQLQAGEGHRIALAYYSDEALTPEIVFGEYSPGSCFRSEAFSAFRSKTQ